MRAGAAVSRAGRTSLQRRDLRPCAPTHSVFLLEAPRMGALVLAHFRIEQISNACTRAFPPTRGVARVVMKRMAAEPPSRDRTSTVPPSISDAGVAVEGAAAGESDIDKERSRALCSRPEGRNIGRPWVFCQQGAEEVGMDVILRSEATKNLLSVPASQSENSRSFAPQDDKMTSRAAETTLPAAW
jgi:hypothetical protein